MSKQPFLYQFMRTIEDEIRQKRFTSARQKAILNLLFTANWIQAQHNSFFRKYGITGAQFNILRILKGQHPQSLSVREITDRMLDRNPDTPRLLNRLLTKGLIEKHTCPNDKRASDVFISRKGLDLVQEINRHQHKLDSIIHLTEEEALLLSNLLDKARHNG
jgi:DNA-binding MarR family transcriptional regulator